MSATYQLFTAWKATKGFTSDNQGTTALGVTRTAASYWKSGRNAELPLVMKMARAVGEDPEAWAMRVLAERSTGEERRIIEKMARRVMVGREGFEPSTNRLKAAALLMVNACIWTSIRLNAVQAIVHRSGVLRIVAHCQMRIPAHHLFA